MKRTDKYFVYVAKYTLSDIENSTNKVRNYHAMKQSTFKAKLNQYYGDVDKYIDTAIRSVVEVAILDKGFTERMTALGLDYKRWKDFADIMFDIIENEEDARQEGKEPVRRVYAYMEPEEGHGTPHNFKDLKERQQGRELWIDYTEDDYLYFVRYREELYRAFTLTAPKHLETMQIITEHFAENADLIVAECMSILHTATKADCQDYFARLRAYIKGLGLDDAFKRELQKNLIGNNGQLEVNFFGIITDPFTRAVQELRQEEHKHLDDQDPKDFIDFVFKDIKRIHDETHAIVTAWYGPPAGEIETGKSRELYLRQTKLARTKEINALQTLNLSRDNKGTRHTSTSSGGLAPVNVFENKNVEILTPRIEDVSLSTNTRQLLDYYFFKGIEQIPHKGSIERLYRQRAVTVDLDELATVFSIDKKEARKRLNSFYDEVRDLKIKLHYYVKEGKRSEKYIATVNIFDADLQKIDQEEQNATARPEDVDEGVQITLYNTGTLLNYNPKRKKEPKNAVRRGQLTMQFSMDFARHLSQASVVRHNPKGYLIDRRKYKSAYSIQTTLEDHAYMNRGKSNAGIISLDALLKDCYEIPTYDTVMNGNRNVTGRIKKPLLSTVQALKDADVLQDFHYVTPDKKDISEADLLTLDYDDFIKCTLHFTLSPIDEEEQTDGSS